jgi:hypothetical protein
MGGAGAVHSDGKPAGSPVALLLAAQRGFHRAVRAAGAAQRRAWLGGET